MATLGAFDPELRAESWFDPELVDVGWFDPELIEAAGGGSVGNGAGASTLTFAASATGQSTAAAAGASTLTFAPTATGASTATAAGASSLTFTPAATGASLAPAAGSSTLTFAPTAAGAATAAAVGSSSLTFGAAGVYTDSEGPTLTDWDGVPSTPTTANLYVTTDEANGNLFVVVTSSINPPTSLQIRTGQDHTGSPAVFADNQVISSTGVKNFLATGLTPSSVYYAYFVHRDASDNDSLVSATDSFTQPPESAGAAAFTFAATASGGLLVPGAGASAFVFAPAGTGAATSATAGAAAFVFAVAAVGDDGSVVTDTGGTAYGGDSSEYSRTEADPDPLGVMIYGESLEYSRS